MLTPVDLSTVDLNRPMAWTKGTWPSSGAPNSPDADDEPPAERRALTSFAVSHVEHHPSTVSISDLKMSAFLKSQATGVDRREAHPVTRQSDTLEYLSHFFDSQNHRQLLFFGCSYQTERAPLSVECPLKEELNPT